MARLTKESEERKHHKEMVVKAAIENWKQVAHLMIKSGSLGKMSPLHVFMVHMAACADVVLPSRTVGDDNSVELELVSLRICFVRAYRKS